MGLTISKQQIAELDRVIYNGDIIVIDHIAQVKDAVNH